MAQRCQKFGHPCDYLRWQGFLHPFSDSYVIYYHLTHIYWLFIMCVCQCVCVLSFHLVYTPRSCKDRLVYFIGNAFLVWLVAGRSVCLCVHMHVYTHTLTLQVSKWHSYANISKPGVQDRISSYFTTTITTNYNKNNLEVCLILLENHSAHQDSEKSLSKAAVWDL